MRLYVRHTTRYHYDTPLANAMQQLRLTPNDGASQKVVDWTIETPGMDRAASYQDAFDNVVHMVSTHDIVETVEITATGTVDTQDTSGVIGFEKGAAPVRIYTRITPLTKANQAIRRLAHVVDEDAPLPGFHELMHSIREKVEYKTGVTETHATAISTFA